MSSFSSFLTMSCLISVLSIPLSAQADEIAQTSSIEKVTVYTDRASVTRLASVAVPAGATAVVISGLPAGLMPESIRTEGSAPVAVTLGAAESRLITGAELAAPKERDLTEKLQALQDERALIVADQKAAEAREAFLKKLGDTAPARANDDISHALTMKPDEWVAASEKLFSATRDTLKTAQGYIVALRKLDAQIAALTQEIDRLKTGDTESYQIKVPVQATAATTLDLRIEYQITGANWTPLYDARLETATTGVTLTQYADVRQNTGEDWTNVALTLSTAQPASAASAPPLSPLWINAFDPSAMQEKATRNTLAMAKSFSAADSSMVAAEVSGSAAMAPMAAPAPVAATVQSAQIETGGYIARYHVPGLVTVTADSATRKVLIQNMKTSAKLIAQIVPALDSNAYVVARTTLKGEAPLLPGKVNLFRDNAYIGSTYQGLLRAGDETDLSFGIDDQIDVKRHVLTDKRGESGIVSKESTLDRLFDTEVTNLHKFNVAAEILEATPTSQTDRVKIVLNTKDTTAGFEDDVKKTKGLKRWTTTLTPGHKYDVKLGWSVTWPAGWILSGL